MNTNTEKAGELTGSRFTPGPWGVEQTDNNNWIGPLRSDDSGKVNEVVVYSNREELKPEALAKVDANARLIAASPELLTTSATLLARTQKLSDALCEMIKGARERNRTAGMTVFNPAALEIAIEALEHDEDCSWPSGHCTCGVSFGTTSGQTCEEIVKARAVIAKVEGHQ